MKLKSVLYLMTFILSIGMTACSSSDDDAPATGDGQKVAQWIHDNVLEAPTAIEVYTDAGSNGSNLYGVVDNEMAARRFCCEMIGCPWDGEAKIYTVPDDYGTIRLVPSDQEGVFYKVVVNVRGIMPFTLSLATREYCQSNNLRHPDMN